MKTRRSGSYRTSGAHTMVHDMFTIRGLAVISAGTLSPNQTIRNNKHCSIELKCSRNVRNVTAHVWPLILGSKIIIYKIPYPTSGDFGHYLGRKTLISEVTNFPRH